MKTKFKGLNFLSNPEIRCHSHFFLNIREMNSTFKNQAHDSLPPPCKAAQALTENAKNLVNVRHCGDEIHYKKL